MMINPAGFARATHKYTKLNLPPIGAKNPIYALVIQKFAKNVQNMQKNIAKNTKSFILSGIFKIRNHYI